MILFVHLCDSKNQYFSLFKFFLPHQMVIIIYSRTKIQRHFKHFLTEWKNVSTWRKKCLKPMLWWPTRLLYNAYIIFIFALMHGVQINSLELINSTFTSAMLDWTVAVTKNRGGVLGNNKLFIFKAPIGERVILIYRTVEVSTLVLQGTSKNWCQTWSKGPFSLNQVLKVSLRTRLKNILKRLISIDCKIHHWTVSDWQPKLIEYSNNVCWIYINYWQIIIFYHWCI